jgi:hypothetical protein
MSDKDIEMLIELANLKLEEAKCMAKKEAILSLNRASRHRRVLAMLLS